MYKNLAATLAVAASFSLSPAFSQAPLKVGFVYVAPVTDTGWVHQHDEGRKAVDQAFGGKVKTTFVENVPEGPDAERVIRDLAQQGHQLIFTPSFGYMEPTLRVAACVAGAATRAACGCCAESVALCGSCGVFPPPHAASNAAATADNNAGRAVIQTFIEGSGCTPRLGLWPSAARYCRWVRSPPGKHAGAISTCGSGRVNGGNR